MAEYYFETNRSTPNTAILSFLFWMLKRFIVSFESYIINHKDFTFICIELTGIPDYGRYNFAVYYTQLCPDSDSVTADEQGTW